MFKIFWSLFLTGVVLGWGPCLLSCGPLLVSYIAATKDSAKSGFFTYIIFSCVRILVYCLFGLLCGIFGEAVVHKFFASEVLIYVFFAFGIFLSLIGFFIIIEKFSFGKCCHNFVCHFCGKKDFKNIVLFSLIISLSPCMPLLAVLGYIVLISDHWMKGIIYMAGFGLGTVISPLILFSGAAGYAAEFLKNKERPLRYLRLFCGAVIFMLGAYFIYSFILSYRY